MLDWLQQLAATAGQAVNESSPVILAALFGVAAFTEVGFPFPFVLDGVLFYTGFVPGRMPTRVLAVMTALFLGRVLGASIIYWLSRRIGGPFLGWLGRRWPKLSTNLDRLKKMLGVAGQERPTGQHVDGRAGAFFEAAWSLLQGPVAVAAARLTPGLLTAASVAAGAMRMRYWVFIGGVLFSSIAADAALILSGLMAGLGVEFLGISPSPWVFAGAFAAVILAIWGVPKLIARRKSRKAPPST